MPRKPKRIPQILSQQEIRKIIDFILSEKKKYRITEYQRFLRARNCVMILLQFLLGLRPKEVYDARMSYLLPDTREFYIPAQNNKQRQQDTIPIPEFIFEKIAAYLAIRNKFFSSSPWLFPSTRPRGRLDRSSLSKLFRKILKQLGLYRVSYIDTKGMSRGNVTLYSLRHSFGSFVYDKTKDIRKTALLLRQYDWQCRSALIYIHTTQNTSRLELLKEIYASP